MIPLRQHHLLMVHYSDPSRGSIPFPIEAGSVLRLDASYIDARTGVKVGDTRLSLTGPQEIHLTASTKELFRGWWYILEWDRLARVYRCGCYEGKTQGFCTHIEQLSPEFVVVA